MEQVLIKEKSVEENFRRGDSTLGCNVHSRLCRFSLAREVLRYSWSQYHHQLHFYLLPALIEQCNRTQDSLKNFKLSEIVLEHVLLANCRSLWMKPRSAEGQAR